MIDNPWLRTSGTLTWATPLSGWCGLAVRRRRQNKCDHGVPRCGRGDVRLGTVRVGELEQEFEVSKIVRREVDDKRAPCACRLFATQSPRLDLFSATVWTLPSRRQSRGERAGIRRPHRRLRHRAEWRGEGAEPPVWSVGKRTKSTELGRPATVRAFIGLQRRSRTLRACSV